MNIRENVKGAPWLPLVVGLSWLVACGVEPGEKKVPAPTMPHPGMETPAAEPAPPAGDSSGSDDQSSGGLFPPGGNDWGAEDSGNSGNEGSNDDSGTSSDDSGTPSGDSDQGATGDSGGDGSDSDDATPPEPPSGTSEDSSEECSREGFLAYQEIGFASTGNTGELNYIYRAGQGSLASMDLLEISSFSAWSGPVEPGVYSLEGVNYRDCGLCLLLSFGCSEAGCESTFYADQGSLEITSIGGDGENFTAVMSDVVFTEVTIAEDLTSTPVEGGETWCMDGYAFDQTMGAGVTTNEANAPGNGSSTAPDSTSDNTPPPAPPAPEPGATDPAPSSDQGVSECVARGTGNGIGDKIGDFSLQNCNGEWVNLHDECGQKKAIWLVQTTGWCPACPGTVVPAAQAQSDYPEMIKSWIVLGQNSLSAPASLNDCDAYINKYEHQGKVDPSMVFIDPGHNTLRTHVFDYNFGGVPWSGVLKGSSMEYVANSSHGDFIGALNQLINE